MESITSPKNPKVLAWRALQTRKGREEQNAFLVEGVRMVREALDSDFDLRALLLLEGVEPAFALPAGVPVFVLSDRVFAAVSETKTRSTKCCPIWRSGRALILKETGWRAANSSETPACFL